MDFPQIKSDKGEMRTIGAFFFGALINSRTKYISDWPDASNSFCSDEFLKPRAKV